MKEKDMDLVIHNDSERDLVLKFLIYLLRTIDGHKNSANPILKNMERKSLRKINLKKSEIS